MAIGTAVLLGTATASGATSLSITTGAPVPPGSAIMIYADSDLRPHFSLVSGVSDGANTYGPDFTGEAGQNIGLSCWSALNTTGTLATGSTITVSFSGGTADISATAVTCPGIATAGAVDQIAFQPETPNRTIPLLTGPLGLDNELAVAYWVSRQAQGAPVITSDWNSFAAFQGAASTHFDNTAWKVVTTADPITATATTPSAGTGWAGVLLTYRAQINPTATLSCGGTVTGFPVIAVNGTATLHCGGSILGPDELAPVAPPQQPTFIAGYGPQVADLQAWIRQSLAYCTEQTVFRAEQTVSGGQSLTGGALTPLTFGSVLEDPWGGWSATSTSKQAANSWLVPWTGWYRVTFRYLTTSGGSAYQDAALGVSGVNPAYEAGGVLSPSSLPGGADASFVVPLIGGADYVQLLANPSVTSTTDTTTAGRRPSVEITSVQTDLQGS